MLVLIRIHAEAHSCKTHLANIISNKFAELGIDCVPGATGDEFKNIDLSLSERIVKDIVQKVGVVQVQFEETVCKK